MQSQPNLQSYQYYYYPQQEANQGAESILGIGADLWVAIFTGALVIATIVQAVLILRAEGLTRAALRLSQRQFVRAKIDARKQAEDMKNSLAIAKQSADSAQLSARAAVGVEAPRLMLFYLDFRDRGNADLAAQIQNPNITVSAQNYGRNPAFIISRAVEVVATVSLPPVPDYSRTAEDVPPETVIGPDLASNSQPGRLEQALTPEEVQSVVEGRLFLIVYGYVRYTDFLNAPHMLRFCKQLQVNDILSLNYRWIEASAPSIYTECF